MFQTTFPFTYRLVLQCSHWKKNICRPATLLEIKFLHRSPSYILVQLKPSDWFLEKGKIGPNWWITSLNFSIPKCAMGQTNSCFAKAARHLSEMLSRYVKDSFFANLNSVQQKRCIDILKGHLKDISELSPQDTAKTTYENVFKIPKRELFCKSDQCLSKSLLRQLCKLTRTYFKDKSVKHFLSKSRIIYLTLIP